jgi:uncharacterized membrane protein (DUF485 family)
MFSIVPLFFFITVVLFNAQLGWVHTHTETQMAWSLMITLAVFVAATIVSMIWAGREFYQYHVKTVSIQPQSRQ